MLPPQMSSAMKKQLIKDLKKLEKMLRKIKKKKVVNFEEYKECREQIDYVRNELSLKI